MALGIVKGSIDSIMHPSNNLGVVRCRGITLSWHHTICGFFFLETNSRNVFCFVVFVLRVMNSTAEIPQPQIDTRRLLVRVLSLHEESDRICCEEKTKMLSQLKSNPCIMYFLAREKTLPIDWMLQNTPKNMLAVQLLSHTLFTQKGKRNKKKTKNKRNNLSDSYALRLFSVI